jgi:two-component system nitrate/nitrite response regulator NarL
MTSTSLQTIRILIAEDNDRLLSGLETTLTIQPDLDVVGTATNGLEAIDSCRELEPDVVLMELTRPERDGISAIKEIHQHQSNIQIIVLSSFSEGALVEKARQVGAVGHIQLGDSAVSLITEIRNAYYGVTQK